MIKIDVSSTQAVIRSQEPLTVGLAGAEVELVFDEAWQSLSKIVVFRQEDVTVDVAYTGQTVTIPHEVLTLPGLPVYIGVYGTDSSGNTVIPTVWAVTDPVQPSADPVSAVNLEPTSPVYTQLLEAMGDLSGLTTDNKTTLVAAINEANYGSYMVTVQKTDDGWWADKDPETLEMHRKRQKNLICHLSIDDVYLPLVSKKHTSLSIFVFAGTYKGVYYHVEIGESVIVETKPADTAAEYPVTVTEESGKWVSDKTMEQILQAMDQGQAPVCLLVIGTNEHRLCMHRTPVVSAAARAIFSGIEGNVSYKVLISAIGGITSVTVTVTDLAQADGRLANPNALTFTGGTEQTYDGSEAVSVNIPGKTSELENDAGFLTTVPVTSVNGQTGDVTIDTESVVTVTVTGNGDGTFSSDKTYQELSEAHAAGKVLICWYYDEDVYLPLVERHGAFHFSCIYNSVECTVTVSYNSTNGTDVRFRSSKLAEEDQLDGYVKTPTAAAAGQAIIVKSVDENGKIVETEPVTLPDPSEYLSYSPNLFDVNSDKNVMGKCIMYKEIRDMEDTRYGITHPIYLEAGVSYKFLRSNMVGGNRKYASVDEEGNMLSTPSVVAEGDYDIATPDTSGWYAFNYNPNNTELMVCRYDEYPERFVPYGRMPAEDIVLNDRQTGQVREVVLSTPTKVNSPLYGKKIVLTGDSICYGAGYTGGYGKIIAEQYGMTYQNVAKSGATVVAGTVNSSTGTNRLWICQSIELMDADADYVVLEGGVNDAVQQVPMGAMSEGYDAELDEYTFYGAFESMLRKAVLKFPGKKICYVMVHKITDSFRSDSSADSYYHAAKACCQKWGVAFCDLGDTVPPFKYFAEGSDLYILRQTYTADGDGTHPNQAGYEAYYVPQIVAFLE